MAKDASVGVWALPRSRGTSPIEVSAWQVSTNEASSTELTPCHIEMSFASGIYSLKHFCLLVPVIVGVARKLLAEWGHRRICSKSYASAPGDRQGGFLAFALGGA